MRLNRLSVLLANFIIGSATASSCAIATSLQASAESPAFAPEQPILIIAARGDRSGSRTGTADSSPSAAAPLTAAEVEQLLAKRVPREMGVSFNHFAGMYLLPIQEKSGLAISLKTNSAAIAKTRLRSPFPLFYRPTLRQFLDEIAWQTRSGWKYDSNEKFSLPKARFASRVKQAAVFEFSEADRRKPFELAPAAGWKAADMGNYTVYAPPASQVSMDVYEMGTYSAQDKSLEAELLKKVQQEVALQWARRVKANAKPADLTNARVGPFDALFFQAKVKTQGKAAKDVQWRQWVFMDGSQCYFIVSTIFPESETKMLPEVEAMLKSFRTIH
jgi:hypothetical protein